QYKADTDSVATWLANTAKAHGYGTETAAAAEEAAKKKAKKKKGDGKGKGPSRAKNKKPKEPLESSTGKYIIRVRDFEAMAKHVAETNAVEVPHRTAIALERVRRSFSQKLQESGARRDRRSDATHSHFVQVLEKVRGYLKSIMEAGLFNPEEKTDKKANQSFKGMFDVLNVYNPSEEFLNAPDITPNPAPEPTQYTVEEDDTWETAFFAFSALLFDYNKLTQEIHSLWRKYAAGELDLAAVSVSTNTAFELAHSMENDVKKLLDKHEGAALLAQGSFDTMCKHLGIDRDRKQPDEAYNLEAYDMAKLLQLNTMSMLKSYLDANRNSVVPGNYNGKFGWYNEKLGAKGRTNREKYNQDKLAQMEIMSSLHFLSTNGGMGAVEDELIRGMGDAIYLDIVQGFGENCDRGYKQFKQETLKVQKTLLDLPATLERKAVLEAATRWNKDPIFMTAKEMKELDLMDGTDTPEFQFLRHNPLHCGLLLHHLRSVLHESGVKAAAYSGGVMCTTQLYQALQQERRIPKGLAWEDLETLWGYQGSPCFFVGNPPKDREGYYRNYCLSLGLSVTNWAPNRRNNQPIAHKSNARNMKFDGWFSRALNNRIVVDNDREPWTTEIVEELLAKGREMSIKDGKGHIQADLKQKAEANPEAVPKSPSGLVNQLAHLVHNEIPRISFNYFTMHDVAWKFMTDLKRAFTAAMGPEVLQYVPSEDQLPYIVGYVFSTASGHGSSDVRERGLSNDEFIDIATDLMSEFLSEGNGRLIKEASEKSVRPSEVAGIDIDGMGLWKTEHFKMNSMLGGGGMNRCGAEEDDALVNELMKLLSGMMGFLHIWKIAGDM
ncbi:hypothetical protein F53441_2974, partial [Fusarium austroafricanum]